ncbi:hypothetical protein KI387_004012, partial [Taxus chinensis]
RRFIEALPRKKALSRGRGQQHAEASGDSQSEMEAHSSPNPQQFELVKCQR